MFYSNKKKKKKKKKRKIEYIVFYKDRMVFVKWIGIVMIGSTSHPPFTPSIFS